MVWTQNPLIIPSAWVPQDPKSASSTGIAKLQSGHYLLAVAGSDAKPLDFYISNEPNDISMGFSFIERIDTGSDISWRAYQSTNLVTECNSENIYLIGTENDGEFGTLWGDDLAALWEIVQINDHLVILRRAGFKGDCSESSSRQCNYDAAAGIYVDPGGNLAIYSTEHDNDGANDSIKFMEFWQQP